MEDVLISKLYALQGKVRPKDLDDLHSIIVSGREIDFAYLRSGISSLGLKLPSTGKEFIPQELRILFR